MAVSKTYFVLEAVIPIIIVAIALACLLYVMPLIREFLVVSSDAWKINLVPMADALFIAVLALFVSFLVIRFMMVYYSYRMRLSLIRGIETGAKHLMELREMIREIHSAQRRKRES